MAQINQRKFEPSFCTNGSPSCHFTNTNFTNTNMQLLTSASQVIATCAVHTNTCSNQDKPITLSSTKIHFTISFRSRNDTITLLIIASCESLHHPFFILPYGEEQQGPQAYCSGWMSDRLPLNNSQGISQNLLVNNTAYYM